MTNKEKLNRLISNCDFIEHMEDYEDLHKALSFLDVVLRIIKSPENWFDPNFGSNNNKLYIDGCIDYLSEEEKQIVLNIIENLKNDV